MDKIYHKPTHYPIPYGLGTDCPVKRCQGIEHEYCFIDTGGNYYKDSNEKPEIIHEKRRLNAVKYLTDVPAYYHLKTGELSDGEYLIGRYYPQGHQIIKGETEELFPRDMYTFHGFLYTPENYTERRNVLPPSTTKNKSSTSDIHSSEDIDFNF